MTGSLGLIHADGAENGVPHAMRPIEASSFYQIMKDIRNSTWHAAKHRAEYGIADNAMAARHINSKLSYLI